MACRFHAPALMFAVAGSACSHPPPLFVTNFAVGMSPFRIAARDFDGDGKLDLVSADSASGIVGIFRGRGDGTFSPSTLRATAAEAGSMAVADFNIRDRIGSAHA